MIPKSSGVGISTRQALSVALLGILLAASGVAYYYVSRPTPTLSFVFESASATYNPSTGLTNITVVLKNTGSLPIKLGGSKGVPPPPGTALINGTFQKSFFSSNGTLLHGGNGPPDTANGGSIRVTFLVSGATVGQQLTLTSSFTQNGLTATKSTSIQVETASTSGLTQTSTPTGTGTTIGTGNGGTTGTTVTNVSTASHTTSSIGSDTSNVGSSQTTLSTKTTTATTTVPTTTATSVTSTITGTLSFYIQGASGSYNSSSQLTAVTVSVVDTGSIALQPRPLRTPPQGTTRVSSVDMRFYSANGTEVYPCGCGFPPDTSNGGKIVATYLVGGAQPGELLTLTYIFAQNGLTAGPESISFIVV